MNYFLKQILSRHKPGSKLHVQILHASNLDGAALLHDQIDELFECTWLPLGQMSLVFGAHTGPSMVGVCFGDQSIFDEIP